MAKATRNRSARDQLLLTCEHGGNRIPAAYARLFRGAADVLASHRGWDPGALDVARAVARKFRIPLYAVTWSRLLVEANRSPTNRRIWSAYTKDLPAEERQRILDRFWWPHRREVEEAVQAGVAQGFRVVHVAVHSFTPVLDGEVRTADVGLLYDPARPGERDFCRRWETAILESDPGFRVRRNYPYRGTADGLTTWLRDRHPDRSYVGVELELNQALFADSCRRHAESVVAASLESLLGPSTSPPGCET